MRYIAAVVFLASCAMLTPAPVEDRASEQPDPSVNAEVHSEANPEQSAARPDARKPKPKRQSPPASEVSSCAKLDAGDLKETIKAKLDCITENAK